MGNKRLSREYEKLLKAPVPGIFFESKTLLPKKDKFDEEWIIVIHGAEETLYSGESYRLRFRFLSTYPIDSPEVQFMANSVPIHPHIYTNGHICLSILYDEWSPALTVSQLCLSIVSMLSSCTEKELPADNAKYLTFAPKSSKDSSWAFHDNC